jgi:hypothetical protein
LKKIEHHGLGVDPDELYELKEACMQYQADEYKRDRALKYAINIFKQFPRDFQFLHNVIKFNLPGVDSVCRFEVRTTRTVTFTGIDVVGSNDEHNECTDVELFKIPKQDLISYMLPQPNSNGGTM